MLTPGALTRAATLCTRPSPAEARLLTTTSMPATPNCPEPPNAMSCAVAPASRYRVPGRSRSVPRRFCEAANCRESSADHSRESEAVRSGVQDRNCGGSTPSTLTCLPAAVILAPSTASTLRTPPSLPIRATWAGLRPFGSMTTTSGRTIW